ncbi:MAG: LON peptidase substrate-binding domain-containing protein [Chloroflexi bacterium]|nr:LON peptidase substrate-binding domain-containing protein [Chloroflexota bacterium]
MASDTALEFKHIDNAEAESDGVFELPLLPLDAQVLFPRVLSLIPLTTKAQINAASFSREQKRTLIACKLKPNQESEALINRIHTVGTEFAPGKSREMADESTQLLAQGRRRVRILEVRQAGAYPVARASVMTEDLVEPQKLDSLADALKELFKHSSQYNEAMPDSIIKHILSLEDPGQLCDSLASILPLPADDLQQLLELEDVAKRLELLAVLLTSDLHDKEMHDEVHARLQDEIAANQREMYLREQVRIIQQELGDGDIFQQEMSQLSERIRASNLPSEVEDKAMKEMSRLGVVPPMSPESGVIHTYLDRLLTLPWNVISDENLNLQNAEDILERAHYGLSKVKARIIEHIAVRKMAKDKKKNPILCLVGPPGVGNT